MKKLGLVLFLFLYLVLLKFAIEMGSDGYLQFKKHSKENKPETVIEIAIPNSPVEKDSAESDSKTVVEEPPALTEETAQKDEKMSVEDKPVDSIEPNRPPQIEIKPVVESEQIVPVQKETPLPSADVKSEKEVGQNEADPLQLHQAATPIETTPAVQSQPTVVPVRVEIKLLVTPASAETEKNEIVPVEIEKRPFAKNETEKPIEKKIELRAESESTPPVQNDPIVLPQIEHPTDQTKNQSTLSNEPQVPAETIKYEPNPVHSEKHPTNPTPPPSSSPLLPKFISIRHVWGDQETECIPFATNYTTLEMLFASNYTMGKIMPMMDLRGHRFDDNTYAANVGLGGRYIPNPDYDYLTEILGFNAYYDYRQGYIGYYNQIGAGIEILSKRWDFRANAYVPFGPKRHMDTTIYTCYTTDYYLIRRSVESISYSFNAEVGCLLFDVSDLFSLYAAGGPYFIARAVQNGGVVGGEARLRPKYKDFIALDMSWRYDHLFGTIWQIDVILNIPLYQIRGKNRSPNYIKNWQIYQPIERFEVMPLSLQNCWQSNF